MIAQEQWRKGRETGLREAAEIVSAREGRFVAYWEIVALADRIGEGDDVEAVASLESLAARQARRFAKGGVVDCGGAPARAVCPGDPRHYADAHSPGGAWFGIPLDHSARR